MRHVLRMLRLGTPYVFCRDFEKTSADANFFLGTSSPPMAFMGLGFVSVGTGKIWDQLWYSGWRSMTLLYSSSSRPSSRVCSRTSLSVRTPLSLLSESITMKRCTRDRRIVSYIVDILSDSEQVKMPGKSYEMLVMRFAVW